MLGGAEGGTVGMQVSASVGESLGLLLDGLLERDFIGVSITENVVGILVISKETNRVETDERDGLFVGYS